jgi:hypothetical protein
VFDGVGSIYSSSMGEFDSTIQLAYGRNRDGAVLVGEERDTDFSEFLSASWTLNRDWLTLRASYARAELVIPFDEFQPLLDGWRGTVTFAGIADDLELSDDSGNFSSFGFIVDRESFLLIGEVTKVDPGDNFFPDQDSYYVTLGKRFGDVLLHVTYGEDEDVSDYTIFANVPAGVDPGLDFLLAQSQGVLASVEEDSSFYTIGLRWEVSSSVAAKFEFTKFEDEQPLLAAEASLFQFALTTVF